MKRKDIRETIVSMCTATMLTGQTQTLELSASKVMVSYMSMWKVFSVSHDMPNRPTWYYYTDLTDVRRGFRHGIPKEQQSTNPHPLKEVVYWISRNNNKKAKESL